MNKNKDYNNKNNIYLNKYIKYKKKYLIAKQKYLEKKLLGGTKIDSNNFKSIKTRLEKNLKGIKPDNEYYNFSKKLIEKLNETKNIENKFYNFINLIFKNYDKIMSGSIKQKGGTQRTRRSTRGDSEDCAICQEELVPRFGPGSTDIQEIVECTQPLGQHKFHLQCIIDYGHNQCPICRDDQTFLDSQNNPINIRQVRAENQINNMDFIFMPNEEIERGRQIQIRRDNDRRLFMTVLNRVTITWFLLLFLFLCYLAREYFVGDISQERGNFYLVLFLSLVIPELMSIEADDDLSFNNGIRTNIAESIVRIMNFLDEDSIEMIMFSL